MPKPASPQSTILPRTKVDTDITVNSAQAMQRAEGREAPFTGPYLEFKTFRFVFGLGLFKQHGGLGDSGSILFGGWGVT